MNRPTLSLPVAWGVVWMLVGVAGPTHAQDSLPVRRVGAAWQEEAPRLQFSVRDLVNGQVRADIDGGLPQTIVTKVYTYRDEGSEVLAATVQSCEVVHDLWAMRYRVRILDVRTERTLWVTNFDEVVETCLVMRNIEVGEPANYRTESGQTIFFAVQVEFNPMSQVTVERIRRLVARGGGFDDQSVFGSFVSMFVNRNIGRAERVVRFRTQSFAVP